MPVLGTKDKQRLLHKKRMKHKPTAALFFKQVSNMYSEVLVRFPTNSNPEKL